MKVIDLLSKLEKNEITNKTKFKWRDSIVINKKGTLYCNDMFFSKILNFGNAEALKEELEIIEEDKPIEKIEIERNSQNANYYIMNEFGTKCFLTKHSKMIAEKINEVIDKIKEHCLKGIEEEPKTRMLPEHSYNMGYHDMAGEILEIIEEITEDKPIQQLKTYSGENYSDDKELIVNKINEIIDKLNKLEKENE